ncbi:RNA 3'-terminal phosphate cyclase [Candidatus Micrarchaeota archaeon]|nr:RNA 3'-terminal phosphate cyclase [Candidatus Micrarchaeota archaeon]
MIEVDGRAGGQVLRTSIALSAVTQTPVTVFNIRANRPNPGLQPQHLTGIQTLAKLCNANLKNAKLESKKIIFYPKKMCGGNYSVNIGTAGSISLLLQTVMIPSLFSANPVNLKLFGGTDVKWSPPYDYLNRVLHPAISKMGVKFSLDLKKRGYYPKGNGFVTFSSNKSKLPLKPLYLVEQSPLQFIKLISHSVNLPKEVILNQLSSARKILLEKIQVDFEELIEFKDTGETNGSGITVIGVFSDGTRIGASALGEKGKPAEKIGREAAENFLKELNSGKPIDKFLADQLIPFMAIAEGHSTIECSEITQHIITNISVVEKFLEVKFDLKGKIGESGEIHVKGLGLT